MSRAMHGDQAAAYRAVIVTTWPTVDPSKAPRSATSYAGPYATAAAARGAISRERRRASEVYRHDDDRRPTVEGHVEMSSITWTKVEAK